MYQIIRYLAFTVFIAFIMSCASSHGGWGTIPGKSRNWKSSQPKKKGPPAHAPAHGYRSKHRYYYYPSCSVYFDIDRKVYFYLSGDNWRMMAELPTTLKGKLGHHVTLELETDKPYTRHKEHQKKHPRGKVKKKK